MPLESPVIRVARVTVQLHAFVDDGTWLTPIATAPIDVAARAFAEFDLDRHVAALQAEYDERKTP